MCIGDFETETEEVADKYREMILKAYNTLTQRMIVSAKRVQEAYKEEESRAKPSAPPPTAKKTPPPTLKAVELPKPPTKAMPPGSSKDGELDHSGEDWVIQDGITTALEDPELQLVHHHMIQVFRGGKSQATSGDRKELVNEILDIARKHNLSSEIVVDFASQLKPIKAGKKKRKASVEENPDHDTDAKGAREKAAEEKTRQEEEQKEKSA